MRRETYSKHLTDGWTTVLIQMFGFFKTPTPVAVVATCTGTRAGPNRLPSLAGLE
jgi:hypothetical protein